MQKASCLQDRDNQLSKAAVRQHLAAVSVRPGLRASGSSSYVRDLKPGLLVCSGVFLDGPPGIPSLQANRDREGRGPSMLHTFDSFGTALGTPSESLIQRLFSSPDLELALPWAVFRLWDLDEDEAISPAELEYGIKKAFPKTGKEELLRLLSAMMGDRENVGLAAPLPTLRNGNAPSSGRDRRETLQGQGKSGVTYLDFVNFVFPPGKADLAAQVSARVMGG
ncbi:unnamed protein product [Symbiodinium sp. CCMP2592]|nr:unnamed protein product [Symbiodinium sp. CCMP2592]